MGERKRLTKPPGGYVLPPSQRKTTPIMIRLDPGQKALLDAAARRSTRHGGPRRKKGASLLQSIGVRGRRFGHESTATTPQSQRATTVPLRGSHGGRVGADKGARSRVWLP